MTIKQSIVLHRALYGRLTVWMAQSGGKIVWACPRGSRAHAVTALRKCFPKAQIVRPGGGSSQGAVSEKPRQLNKMWRAETLAMNGTPFQQAVWRALLDCPAGETRTYQEIAAMIGRPRSYRAVANACGQNELAPIVPCHRAVRSDGSLGGYRWGVRIKRMLLDAESNRCRVK